MNKKMSDRLFFRTLEEHYSREPQITKYDILLKVSMCKFIRVLRLQLGALFKTQSPEMVRETLYNMFPVDLKHKEKKTEVPQETFLASLVYGAARMQNMQAIE